MNQVDVTINVDTSNQYQRVYGYGGALTQSSAYLFSEMLKTNETFGMDVLKSLFDPNEGIGISMLRVPASSCDFSLYNYTYDDVVGDTALDHLSINIDLLYTIPIIKTIQQFNPNIRLIYTPWSAPTWMKSSDSLDYGTLNLNMYDVYTDFITKFITLYKEEQGIDIYAITIQNEPLFQPMTYPGMLVTSQVETSLVKLLGPKLKAANLSTEIFIYDHNWIDPEYPLDILSDEDAYPYVGATAFHCYQGDVSNQSVVYTKFPEKEIHMTECSGGAWAPNFSDNLVWASDNLYIGAMTNWASSMLQWNFALNTQSGPTNHGCLNCRGFITVDESTYQSIEYNVEYYGTAHYNKFISQPCFRIDSEIINNSQQPSSSCINSIAYSNSDGNSYHVVVVNSCSTIMNLQLNLVQENIYLTYSLPIGLTTFYF
ncbi:glycoside hydrolase family 30 protein [Cavenderia fasciculata]|uniref:Glycoside hydrolase family 30 protein n=1 Tax=Cavenderia fasciculata TaxID=261658 RepID=F4PTD1_CACFS|nr:glycoside hydrolase family 30 protein [Cavenderia fasciculata]EGG21653.1 glycoside hydrolase family 30 protein [Cavenderia fasciculata]|eukprot:XP_004359503.1 glycoside hydrolase family 30 protein [Cavenderia fasciculata]